MQKAAESSSEESGPAYITTRRQDPEDYSLILLLRLGSRDGKYFRIKKKE